LRAVSGYDTNACSAAPMHSTPKMMKIFHVMLRKAGGTNSPSAKLKSQFASEAIDMPYARVSSDHTSDAYTQATGASVSA
jgi:hypothetical protein